MTVFTHRKVFLYWLIFLTVEYFFAPAPRLLWFIGSGVFGLTLLYGLFFLERELSRGTEVEDVPAPSTDPEGDRYREYIFEKTKSSAANRADISCDGKDGKEFLEGLYDSWSEFLDENWVEFLEGTLKEDKIHDESHLFADNAASYSLVYHGEVASAWTDLRGWEYDNDVDLEYGGPTTDTAWGSLTTRRQRCGLFIVAELYLASLNIVADEALDYLDIEAE
ncbi:hypothetical protein UFOVP978_40 [uncultured Caudovirales phage]|uniref:Uncharacterized protein n=1 Tax=uncultured Caudovirales phage TaxID=2100421 RepID=A0A6J5Q2M5_9CAUD|nr:hypothetical protein UFOVP978_40 [uncultured Caudovirales phage]